MSQTQSFKITKQPSLNERDASRKPDKKKQAKTRITFDIHDYKPLRFGMSLKPISLLLKYYKPSIQKNCHHRINLTRFRCTDFDPDKILEYIKKRHHDWFPSKYISDATLSGLITRLQKKFLKFRATNPEFFDPNSQTARSNQAEPNQGAKYHNSPDKKQYSTQPQHKNLTSPYTIITNASDEYTESRRRGHNRGGNNRGADPLIDSYGQKESQFQEEFMEEDIGDSNGSPHYESGNVTGGQSKFQNTGHGQGDGYNVQGAGANFSQSSDQRKPENSLPRLKQSSIFGKETGMKPKAYISQQEMKLEATLGVSYGDD
jgi:hypothetical protein